MFLEREAYFKFHPAVKIMLDLSEAQNIARMEVARIVDSDLGLSQSEVEDIRLARENHAVWIFTADIPKLINEGWNPGAITVFVDKTDGHILTEQQQVVVHKNWEGTRRRAGFIRS